MGADFIKERTTTNAAAGLDRIAVVQSRKTGAQYDLSQHFLHTTLENIERMLADLPPITDIHDLLVSCEIGFHQGRALQGGVLSLDDMEQIAQYMSNNPDMDFRPLKRLPDYSSTEP